MIRYNKDKEEEKSEVGIMRKKFCVLAAVLLAALQGCGGGQEDTGADNVEEVVENLFEDLEEEEYEEIRGQADGDSSAEALASTELPQWVSERFQEYMTEEGYADLTGTGMYEIPVNAFAQDKEISLENLEIRQEEENYEISGELTVSGQGGENTIQIQGSAQTDQEGLVSYLNISNMQEIEEAVQS